VNLTVLNYPQANPWCTIAIAVTGQNPNTDYTQTVCVTPGIVGVGAHPNTGFELGPTPWHDTDGDTGSGDPGTVNAGSSSTFVTVGTTAKCIWACCPFTNGTGCPTADQCPH
jgi:hypothetical protein